MNYVCLKLGTGKYQSAMTNPFTFCEKINLADSVYQVKLISILLFSDTVRQVEDNIKRYANSGVAATCGLKSTEISRSVCGRLTGNDYCGRGLIDGPRFFVRFRNVLRCFHMPEPILRYYRL